MTITRNLRKRELESYIAAKGDYLPLEIGCYDTLGIKGDYCVFCDEEHDEYSTVRFRSGQQCYTCESCDYEITLMKVGASMHELGHTAAQNLHSFMDDGLFPLHAWDYSRNHPQTCVFCTKIADISNCTKLDLPLGKENVNYGKIVACRTCADYALEKLNDYVENSYHDSCLSCKSNYPIIYSEHSARMSKGTLTKHYCGDCWITKGYTMESPRFVPKLCNACDTSVILDLSINFDLNPNMELGRFLCDKCKDAGITTEHVRWDLKGEEAVLGPLQGPQNIRLLQKYIENARSYRLILDSYALLIVQKSTGLLGYQIYGLDDAQTKFEALYYSRKRFKDEVEAVMWGIDKVYEIHNSNETQYKLWKNR